MTAMPSPSVNPKAIEREDFPAEREGFEPSDPVTQVNSLAVSPIRPLSHLSSAGQRHIRFGRSGRLPLTAPHRDALTHGASVGAHEGGIEMAGKRAQGSGSVTARPGYRG